jgi:hypothetical protein
MGHGPSSFKEADVKRAVKAVEAAGKEVESVEIEQGRIKIKVRRRNGGKDDNSNSNTNPWDSIDLK